MRNPFRRQSPPSGMYGGPACYVPFDHLGIDGKQLLGGWHYSTRIWQGQEIPDRRLHLNDDTAGAEFYEYAEDGHLSWAAKHGEGNVVQLGGE